MAKVDIKTGTSLIEIYEGNPEKLDNFLDSVALFVDLVDSANAESTPAAQAAAKAVAIRFIKTRLAGAARQAVPENASLNELVDALKQNCSSRKTADNILAKLKMLSNLQTQKHSAMRLKNLLKN